MAFLKASKQINVSPDGVDAAQTIESAFRLLKQALERATEALELSQVWFENASRRTKRLQHLSDSIKSTIDSLSF